jgi:hypothetical protein
LYFIVAPSTLAAMAVLISLLASAAAVGLLAELIRRGFRDGDRADDPIVEAHSLPAHPDAPGTWVEAVIENRSPAVALVGLTLRASRRPRWWPRSAVARRGGVRRPRARISEQTVGAISAGETARFWLWAAGGGSLVVHAAIGTPRRLRLHRLSLSIPPAMGDGAAPRPDPPEVLIRSAGPSDAHALTQLAALDEAPLPAGPLLVAEVGGALWTAVSIASGDAIADPFRATAAVVDLVRVRAGQLRASPAAARRRDLRSATAAISTLASNRR